MNQGNASGGPNRPRAGNPNPTSAVPTTNTNSKSATAVRKAPAPSASSSMKALTPKSTLASTGPSVLGLAVKGPGVHVGQVPAQAQVPVVLGVTRTIHGAPPQSSVPAALKKPNHIHSHPKPNTNTVSIAAEPSNKPVKMGTMTVIGATPITFRSSQQQPASSTTVRNTHVGAKGVGGGGGGGATHTGAVVQGVGIGRSTVVMPVHGTKSKLSYVGKGGVVSKSSMMKLSTKPSAKVTTSASSSVVANHNFREGLVSRGSIKTPSSAGGVSTSAKMLSSSSGASTSKIVRKPISHTMPAPEPIPSKNSSSSTPTARMALQHAALNNAAGTAAASGGTMTMKISSTAQQSNSETKGPVPKSLSSTSATGLVGPGGGLSHPTPTNTSTSSASATSASAINILPQPLHNPEITTVIQDILLLLQIYGPLTLYQLEYNLPPYKSSTLTDRMQDLKDILDMLVVVGVLQYLCDDDSEKDKSQIQMVGQEGITVADVAPVKKEHELNDTSKTVAQQSSTSMKGKVESNSDNLNNGRYLYVSGRLRAPGDIVYPWEILDRIQEANVEIRERTERIKCLRKELSSSIPSMPFVNSTAPVPIQQKTDVLDQEINSRVENMSNDWDTLFRNLQDRDIKSGGYLTPKDNMSSNQRIKATREFFKAMMEKYPEIGHDPVYVAAMRNFNVDWGASGRGSRGQSGSRKRVTSSGGGTSGKKRRSISASSKSKVHSPAPLIKQKLPTIKPISDKLTTSSATKTNPALRETPKASPMSPMTTGYNSKPNAKSSKVNDVPLIKSASIQVLPNTEKGRVVESNAAINKVLESQENAKVLSTNHNAETMAIHDSSIKHLPGLQEESQTAKKRKITQSLETSSSPGVDTNNGTKQMHTSTNKEDQDKCQ